MFSDKRQQVTHTGSSKQKIDTSTQNHPDTKRFSAFTFSLRSGTGNSIKHSTHIINPQAILHLLMRHALQIMYILCVKYSLSCRFASPLLLPVE